MSKAEGAGSVWNVNSWHWESKNYSQLAKAIIEEKFLTLVFEPNKDIKIRHTNVKFLKNEAQINIRKGKQILVYDFDLELTVSGKQLNNSGQHESEDNSEGSYKVRQIINDNLDDIIVQDIKATQKNNTANEMKKWLKSNVKNHVIKLFEHFEEDLKKIESDPQKLEEDKKRRQQLLKATQKAREQRGALKEKLLEQQREKERKAKQQAYKKTLQEKFASSK